MALSERALCELADLKTELGISGASEDSRLERLIESTTNAIERWCGRPYGFHYEAARVDDVKGYGTPILQVPKTPVASIGSIVYDPNDANDTVSTDNYWLDKGDQGRIYSRSGWEWSAGFIQNITVSPLPGTEEHIYRVTYACGWVTANQVTLSVATPRTLPYDLEDACIMLAALRYKWAPRDPSITAEKLLSWSASYGGGGGTSSGIQPSQLRDVLGHYRKLVYA